MWTSSKINDYSRRLTKLLRHGIHNSGLGQQLRPDGYVPLDAVLGLQQFKEVTVELVREMVRVNDKERFGLLEESGQILIRANQGHTISGVNDEALLGNPLTQAEAQALGGGKGLAVHGTYNAAWALITASGGLKKMTRQHIHLATGLPGDSGVISGMRKSCEIVIWVDVAAAVHSGLRFYASQNGVILTPGDERGMLPATFFRTVVNRSTGAELPVHAAVLAAGAASSSSSSSSSSTAGAAAGAAPPQHATAPSPGTQPGLELWKESSLIERLPLPAGTHIAGRSEDAHIVTEHPSCSRRHASLVVSSDLCTVTLTDLNSAQGTLLDGQPLAAHVPTLLTHGSTIILAQSTRRMVLDLPAARHASTHAASSISSSAAATAAAATAAAATAAAAAAAAAARTAPLSADEKRKLLWGGKAARGGSANQASAWRGAAAVLGGGERSERFLALTGAKRLRESADVPGEDGGGSGGAGGAGGPCSGLGGMAEQQHEEEAAAVASQRQQAALFASLERQHEQARGGRRSL